MNAEAAWRFSTLGLGVYFWSPGTACSVFRMKCPRGETLNHCVVSSWGAFSWGVGLSNNGSVCVCVCVHTHLVGGHFNEWAFFCGELSPFQSNEMLRKPFAYRCYIRYTLLKESALIHCETEVWRRTQYSLTGLCHFVWCHVVSCPLCVGVN